MSDFNSMDLDSLDALLDAAEIEAVAEDAPSTDPPPAETAEEDAGLDDWGAALAEQASATEEADDWGAALSEQAAALDAVPVSTTPPPTAPPTAPPTLAPTAPPTVAPVAIPEPVAVQEAPASKLDAAPTAHQDEPVSKPTQVKKQPANTETWTEAEMDSLKKLVIIFGSITIVLILTAIGIGLGGLLSDVKPDPKLVETIEGIKNDVGQAYLVTEDSGKQLKAMGTQLSDVATQLAEITDSVEALKKAPIAAHAAAPASTGKPMSASERKAAMREEIQANAANTGDGSDNADTGEVVVEKVEKSVNYAQVKALSVDILDVKKRLVATQKLLEQINKQSEALQLQSLTLTEAVKAVEVEMKTHNKPPVRVVSSVNKKAVEDKKAEEKPVAPPVQVKPADDPQFRARWSREMGKSDGFP